MLHRFPRVVCLAIGALFASMAIFATAASAATTSSPFGCRASALRVGLLGGTVLEPTIANPKQTPCATQSAGVATTSVPVSGTALVTAGPVGAFTDNADASGTSPGVGAVASVQGVTIPTGSGDIYVAGPIQSSATYTCADGKLTGTASSTLNVIYINGTSHQIPTGSETTFNLGGGAYIDTNVLTKTATSLTEQSLVVHIPGLLDVVVAEATVSQSNSDPCAGTTGPAPPIEICPPGSTLQVVQQECVIIYRGTIIIVSRPFKGPSGGTVIALPVARHKYHSPCLYGPGPRYALVAKKRGGRVLGTLYSDRILGLGAYERIAGLGGRDCIDGKAGHDKLFDGNGKDRIYARKATNRIAVGNGNDQLHGGSGADYITAGNGNDRIHGNGGNDRINGGLGRDHIWGGAGRNRIYTPGVNAKVSCGSKPGGTAFLRRKAMPYARAHNCTRIVHLQ